MTEAEDGLDQPAFGIVNHPFEVFGLQVRDADMADNALLLQLMERGKSLFRHLFQAAGQGGLELYIVDIDKVDVVDVQALHALIHALLRPLG